MSTWSSWIPGWGAAAATKPENDDEVVFPTADPTEVQETKVVPNTKQFNERGEWVSFSDLHGDWENKEITLFGTVLSFVSQLKIGQDLTRVSLPSMFLRPYSMLEVFGRRQTNGRNYIAVAIETEDPYHRMLNIVRWFLSQVRQEVDQFEKKPYNPVHGEVHKCWIDEGEGEITSFISEQVSHHPPITAVYINNTKDDYTIFGNYTFNVKFGMNSLTIKTDGHMEVNLFKLKEKYICSPKALPDMNVWKLIWGGKKQIIWSGEISIVCNETQLQANLKFDQKGSINIFEGSIVNLTKPKVPLCKFEGECGKETFFKSKEKTEKELLIDVSKQEQVELKYPPREEHDSLSSMIIWEQVNLAIVEDDMYRADAEKRQVEDHQRMLRRNNQLPEPRFFKFDEESKLYLPIYKADGHASHPPTLPQSRFELKAPNPPETQAQPLSPASTSESSSTSPKPDTEQVQ